MRADADWVPPRLFRMPGGFEGILASRKYREASCLSFPHRPEMPNLVLTSALLPAGRSLTRRKTAI